jgi:hypothetical protein
MANQPTGNHPKGEIAMGSSELKTGGYLLASFVTLGIYFLIFELRYMWYLGASEFAFLRICNIACLLVIVALWAFFPSPFLVALVALLGLIFPPFYDQSTFATVDLRFAGVVLLGVGLLVAATYLWRGVHE